MILVYIVLATAIGGMASVLLAATLTLAVLGRVVRSLVSLSAGVLLGTSLLHALPEAFDSGAGAQPLFATLLGGLLFFWLLEKADLYRHMHHHEGDGHAHASHFDAAQAGRGGLAVLVGDGVHNFCDGVLIAAAFLADPALGVVTAFAVAAHEIPQEAGDYIVLLNAGFTRRRALAFNMLSGVAAVAGGIAGYFLVGPWQATLPYLLVVASSSFIYVAVADLLPQLQQRLSWRETAIQLGWLAGGLALVAGARALLHVH
ncbi:MAG: ZIP family metal transporter [Proteobacteria bacterium]|nr:ZIP family metal transporter [Pseudomonadota bacterium]